MQFRHYFLLWLFLMIILMSILKAYADCSPVNGWQNRPLMLNFPERLAVQPDLPVGSVFYETEVSENHNGEKYVNCTGRNTLGVKYLNGRVTRGDGVAATNIDGVGIRIHWILANGQAIRVPTDPFQTMNGPGALTWGVGPKWKVELVKTGAISGGTMKTGGYTAYGVGGMYVSILRVSGGGNIVPTGCSLRSPDVYVPLGRRLRSEFSGSGVTPWHIFDIQLNCLQGTRINVRIDAVADVSGVPGVMKLDNQKGDMAATGVGIQLWYRSGGGRPGIGGTPVVFGREIEYDTSESGGAEAVRLQARYYQTGSRITAGKADGTATFTLTYR
ncbi:fimbrial protein [Pluralibacter sp.]|uniref:fimbrial protein n=1 Tax=Pluralibacter sp. TaxID=1920032 RepID=UPI0025EB0633|nr:fimbrial protein [Pluralibacter sp.]MBV8044144.1 fimbrial protein [Pluralibacter sp.]